MFWVDKKATVPATSGNIEDFTDDEYYKDNELSSVKIEKSKSIQVKFKDEIVEPTRNLFLTKAKFYGQKYDGYFWIEIMDNESSLRRILDIHLTSQCLVESFKERKPKSVNIEIVQINKLASKSKWITMILTDEELVKSEIKVPSNIESDVLGCFTHFT